MTSTAEARLQREESRAWSRTRRAATVVCASVPLRAKDDKSGKLLPGATVTIGTGDKTLLTLTPGDKGTVTAKPPVTNRTGTDFWGKEIKEPASMTSTRGRASSRPSPATRST